MEEDTNDRPEPPRPTLHKSEPEPWVYIEHHLIVIDPEFQDMLGPLKRDEHKTLTANITIRDGRLLQPIVLWPQPDGTYILIDGHNRYQICREHGIEPGFVFRAFASREKAKEYIYQEHKGRRHVVDWAAIEAHLDSPERKQFEAEAAGRKGGRPHAKTIRSWLGTPIQDAG